MKHAIALVHCLLVLLPLAAKPIRNAECVACHDDKGPEKFRSKSHRDLLCVKCHAGIASLPHEDKVPPVDCGTCHAHEMEDYKTSVHGLARLKGSAHAATCTSCHGPAHDIVSPRNPESRVAKANMQATCGACHQKSFLEQLATRLPHRSSRMDIRPDQLKPATPKP